MLEKKKFIQQLNPNDIVNDLFLTQKKEEKYTRKGVLYYDVLLADKTGSLIGKIWNAGNRNFNFEQGEIVYVYGRVTSYEGTRQIQIDYIRPVGNDYDLSLFLPTSEKIEKVKAEILEFGKSLTNFNARKLFNAFFGQKELSDKFFSVCGGIKNHHNYRGGLAVHSNNVKNIAVFLAEQYPGIDRDIVGLAALLHDVGKIKGYSADINLELTENEELFGHIVLGIEIVNELIRNENYDEEFVKILKSCIIGHHGKMEWGSPVPPKHIEAWCVHYADLCDSELDALNALQQEYLETEEKWSRYEKGRKIYLGHKNKRSIPGIIKPVNSINEKGINKKEIVF